MCLRLFAQGKPATESANDFVARKVAESKAFPTLANVQPSTPSAAHRADVLAPPSSARNPLAVLSPGAQTPANAPTARASQAKSRLAGRQPGVQTPAPPTHTSQPASAILSRARASADVAERVLVSGGSTGSNDAAIEAMQAQLPEDLQVAVK